MTIFLLGYMASGKTTLGRALARRLGYDFIDLDFYIEQRFRKRISRIFEESGEGEFRRMEAAMLREAGEFCNTVISCGGGTPCFNENMEYMKKAGVTIWLDATVERICQRLLQAKVKRPLIVGKSPEELPDFISAHLDQRLPFYSRAAIRIPSDRLESRPQIAAAVETLLPQLYVK